LQRRRICPLSGQDVSLTPHHEETLVEGRDNSAIQRTQAFIFSPYEPVSLGNKTMERIVNDIVSLLAVP
jgi:hypothetical protein